MVAAATDARRLIRRCFGTSDVTDTDTDPPDYLSWCAREPIHIPGQIQPQGALLAATLDGMLVSHCSANVGAFLAASVEAVLGRKLAETIGEVACNELQRSNASGAVRVERTCALTARDGTPLLLTAHISGRYLSIDIERTAPNPCLKSPITMALSLLESCACATSADELCRTVVTGMRSISCYDRVMVYRFGSDGHGEVIAEARAAEATPYLGLHYPAGDIPVQARHLYLQHRVGAVADADYIPVPIIVDPRLDDGTALDLTHSCLRSVSSVHREYMRNMEVAASLTIGLADGVNLWGLLVCHNDTQRVADADLRALGGIVGQVMSTLLPNLGRTELHTHRHRRQATLRTLVDRLSAPVDLLEALASAQDELLRVVNADGAIVSISGKTRCLGRTPPSAIAQRALSTLMLAGGFEMLAIEDLGSRHPALAGCSTDGSGVLLLPLQPGTDDAILWFRPELSRTVNWGGDPSLHGGADPASGRLSPRKSFAIWHETVRGRSAAWEDVDLALAQDLRGAIEGEFARRVKSELAWLRDSDNLAARPNRHRELERSNADLEDFAYAASHDMRAPLRAIAHLAQWIGEDLGPSAAPDTAENLKLLHGRVARLESLLDGLLAYSRVSRLHDVEIQDIRVADLVADIAAMLSPPDSFVVRCDVDIPVLRSRRAPLEAVLRNLIDNAIKHHDRDTGRVDVTAHSVDGVAEFRVSDDGRGIEPRFHQRIFQIFQTLASRDELEASGIGLAVVRKMVEANGGKVRVESAPPARGSAFVFTWVDAPR